MPITSNVLKDARYSAKLTQAELAEKLGVSPRTVVNWEKHGSTVPERSEMQVANILGLLPRTDGSWELIGSEKSRATMHNRPALDRSESVDEAEQAMIDNIAGQIGKSAQRVRERHTQDKATAARQIAGVLVGAREAIKFAEKASAAGAHPLTIVRLLESVTAICIETGASTLPGLPTAVFLHEVLDGSKDVIWDAVEAYVPGEVEPFLYEQQGARQRIAEKDRVAQESGVNRSDRQHGGNVTPLRQNAESEDHFEIPDNVEEEWAGRYAADPAGDDPIDHGAP